MHPYYKLELYFFEDWDCSALIVKVESSLPVLIITLFVSDASSELFGITKAFDKMLEKQVLACV